MTEKQYHFRVDELTKKRLMRISQIKRWQYITFQQFIGELFASSMDMLDDESIPIEKLRELYGNWQLAVLPYGDVKHE